MLRQTSGSVCLECRSNDCRHLRPNPPSLSAADLSIIRLVAAVKSNKEIAWSLGFTECTVNQYISTIYRKLDIGGSGARILLAFWARDHADLLKKVGSAA
jgi:DNA-binding NarL/FixJ family response regulator